MHKIALTGLVAAAALLGSVGPAAVAGAATAAPAAARPAPMSVRAQAARLSLPAVATLPGNPAPIAPNGAARISCGSPTACLAVGANVDDKGVTPTAIALEGTAWKTIPVPVARPGALDTSLDGVSCRAATYCLVTGDYEDDSGNDYPYVLAWNGSKLAPVPAPPVPHGDSFGSMNLVSCVAVKSCVLFGSAYGTGSGATAQLTWTWNGSKWTVKAVTMPDGAQDAELTAARCFSVTSCEVAGDYQTTTTSGTSTTETYYLFFAAWNGKAFTLQRAAVPAGLSYGAITDLSCVSPGSCAATGIGITSTGGDSGGGITEVDSLWGFVEAWNGKAWTATKWTGPKGATSSLLYGVSCVSATNCAAVGVVLGSAGKTETAAAASLVWNGTKWLVTGVPSAGKGILTAFSGVSCPKAGACVAIGEYAPATAQTGKPLAGYWNGTRWKLKGA